MPDVHRVAGVVVPDELCPSLARLLRLGLRVAADADGYVPAPATRDAIDLITATARDVVRTVDGPSARRSTVLPEALVPAEIDTTEAAESLGIRPRSLRRLISEGKIRGRQVGRIWVVERRSVDEYQGRPR